MKGNKFHPLWGEGVWGQNTLGELDTVVWKRLNHLTGIMKKAWVIVPLGLQNMHG